MVFKNARRRLRHPLRKASAQRRALLVDVTTDGRPIPASDVRAGLREIVSDRVYIVIADREYLALSEPILKAFLAHDGTDRYPYTAEGGSCDDFAYILKGRVCEAQIRASSNRPVVLGIAHGRFQLDDTLTEPHAMCFALFEDGRFVLIDPKNDRTYPFTADSRVYFIEL